MADEDKVEVVGKVSRLGVDIPVIKKTKREVDGKPGDVYWLADSSQLTLEEKVRWLSDEVANKRLDAFFQQKSQQLSYDDNDKIVSPEQFIKDMATLKVSGATIADLRDQMRAIVLEEMTVAGLTGEQLQGLVKQVAELQTAIDARARTKDKKDAATAAATT